MLLEKAILEIETIRLQVMLTRKSKICCSVDKKGACVYMCYIWFCSVINFAWKKCKKLRKIKWKWRIGFLTVLYCYIAVAIGFNILMWLSFFFPYCSASIIVTVRTTDFYFKGKYAMYKDSSKLHYGWFRKFSYGNFICVTIF